MDENQDSAVEAFARHLHATGNGKIAAVKAAAEHGLEPSEVAYRAAKRGAYIEKVRRSERGQFTQEEMREFLRQHLAPRLDADRVVRTVVKRLVWDALTEGRGARSISDRYMELVEEFDLGKDERLKVEHEVWQLFMLLPKDFDPRTPRKADIPTSSFMWPHLERSIFYRWIPRG